MVTLSGLPSSHESFIQSVFGREELPNFDRLWDDCVQEEAIVLSKNSLQKHQEEENQALARKEKGRKIQVKDQLEQKGRRIIF